MKSPPLQFTDDQARELVEAFIRGEAEAAPAQHAASGATATTTVPMQKEI